MMRPRETFSPDQCRAARGLLNWSSEDLADRARLELEAVEIYEAGAAELGATELAKLGRALTAAGVVALPEHLAGEGVRWARPRGPDVTSPAPYAAPPGSSFGHLTVAVARRQIGCIVADLASHLTTPLHLRSVHDRRA